MINTPPQISVIIPIYNVEKYLPRCLDSVLNAGMDNIEVICVNDASPDGSSDIIERYSKKDARVRAITKTKNEGTMLARETGYENARGEYIFFIDADDMVVEGALEKLYSAGKGNDADIVITDYYTLNRKGKMIYCDRTSGITTDPESYQMGMLQNKSCTLWGHLFRRNLFTDFKYISFNILLSEDRILFIQMLKNATKIFPLSFPSIVYTINDNAVTQNHMSEEKLRQNLFGITWCRNFHKGSEKFEHQATVKYLRTLSYILECGYPLPIIMEYLNDDAHLLTFDILKKYLGTRLAAHTVLSIKSRTYRRLANRARMMIRKHLGK